jgi:hypothetical protein
MLADKREVYLNVARKVGKTTLFVKNALEYAIQHRNVDIPYIGPTQNQVERFVLPIFELMGMDAPEGYRPEWHDQKKYMHVPATNSKIHLRGTDNKRFEDLRGPQYPFSVLDEAGEIVRLKYILNSIIRPAGSRC